MAQVGIDTGGTFTDTVLVDESGEVFATKTLTTNDLLSGVLEGFIRTCKAANIEPQDVTTFTHGSTVALNALLEGNGAKTALITTEGFRDVLEAGEVFRDGTLLYDPTGAHEEPLIPRRFRYGVSERVAADGSIKTPLNGEAVGDILHEAETRDIESVAVCLLHAYRNSDHEEAIAQRIEEQCPDLAVSISSQVSPKIREYSRTATVAVDAYVKPTVSDYISELENELTAQGFEGALTIMTSSGGVAGPRIVSERPVTQLISGPVAGIEAAAFIGKQTGEEDLITLDMGGTSCDVSIVIDGEAGTTLHRDVHGMKVNGPFVNLNTVGAGGGSIAQVDNVGALRVGPESAGADPGPVCYGRGGERPTVTDADLVLGILNPDNFAGGELQLDIQRAREAIREHVADPLGTSVEDAAVAIRDVIDNEMASALRVVSVEEGHDPREFTLMGYGGAGPMHACNIAAELDIDRVLFPETPGLLSALGLIVADVRHDYTRSLVTSVDTADREAINEAVSELLEQGNGDLESENIPRGDRVYQVAFDMMYAGQAHQLKIQHGTETGSEPIDGLRLREDDLSTLIDAFERQHRAQFGFVDADNSVELVNLRITVMGPSDVPSLQSTEPSQTAADAGERHVTLDTDERVAASCYQWEGVTPGDSIAGPAIVELSNSTIWIPPAFDAVMDRYRNLIADRGR